MSNTIQKHPFHLVDPSPWPIFSSIGALTSTVGGVLYFHGYAAGNNLLPLGISIILYSMFVWWRDIIREGTFEGHHTNCSTWTSLWYDSFYCFRNYVLFCFFLGILPFKSFSNY